MPVVCCSVKAALVVRSRSLFSFTDQFGSGRIAMSLEAAPFIGRMRVLPHNVVKVRPDKLPHLVSEGEVRMHCELLAALSNQILRGGHGHQQILRVQNSAEVVHCRG